MASAKTKVCDVVSRLSAVTSNATREAWWMLSAAAGKSQHHLVQDAVEARNPIPELEIEIGKMLNPSQSENFDKMISDRIDARKPLQYILGDVSFCSLKLRTRQPILIPRPETEELSAWLIAHIRALEQCRTTGAPLPAALTDVQDTIRGFPVHKFRHGSFDAIRSQHNVARSALQSPAFNLLDLCSGSGSIALALASQFPLADVLGADADERAVRLARENGTLNGVLNAYFSHCDVFVDRRSPTAMASDDSTHPHPDGAAGSGSGSGAAGALKGASAPAAPLGLLDLQARGNAKGNFYTSTLTAHSMPQAATQSPKSRLFDMLVSNPPYVTAAEHSTLAPEVRDWENRDALVPNVPASFRAEAAAHACAMSASVHWPTAEEAETLALAFYERIAWTAPRLLRPIEEIWLRNAVSTPTPTFAHSGNTSLGVSAAAAAAEAAPPLSATVERAVLSQVPRVVLEVGSQDQAVAVAGMLKAQNFRAELFLDGGDKVRWVTGFHSV